MSKWKLATKVDPPEDRKFLAIFKRNFYAILSWSPMDGCWYISPISKADYKIYKEDIIWWREMPKFPPEYERLLI